MRAFAVVRECYHACPLCILPRGRDVPELLPAPPVVPARKPSPVARRRQRRLAPGLGQQPKYSEPRSRQGKAAALARPDAISSVLVRTTAAEPKGATSRERPRAGAGAGVRSRPRVPGEALRPAHARAWG